MSPLTFTPVPGFVDNYFWVIHRDGQAVVVDPGDAAPVLDFLATQGLALAAILVTHHHRDHIGGIDRILRKFPVPTYGPRAESSAIPGLTVLLGEGDRVTLDALGLELAVWSVPGHTLGHIAYLGRQPEPGFVLCGDTLFKAGCGRLFEGTAAQLHESLARLAALPGNTAVYCTHEYTLANLRFAAAVDPDNPAISEETTRITELRRQGLPSLPSTIEIERRTNPFLRCEDAAVRASAESFAGRPLADSGDAFAALRLWKDRFPSV